MKVLVTGAKGQLGYDVVRELVGRGHEAIGVDIQEMDITCYQNVENTLTELQPQAVIHCAAWTAVDAAEEPENSHMVHQVNVVGTENIAKVCRALNAKMIYISTDYVFDGSGERPWEPQDARSPLSAYGQSKCHGELAVEKWLESYYIVRIAWVFGVNGKNFIKTMLSLGQTRENLSVVDDQMGTPTYTYDLSRLLVDMVETDRYGHYHVTNEGGYISWYDFAQEIFSQAAQINPVYGRVQVNPVDSSAYPAKAVRPKNSRLNKEKLAQSGFAPLPAWKNALERYLKEIEV